MNTRESGATIHYVIHFYRHARESGENQDALIHSSETLQLPYPLLRIGLEFLYDFRRETGRYQIEKVVPHLCWDENSRRTRLTMHVYARPVDSIAGETVKTLQDEYDELR